jgi:hypothetical protein
MAWIDLLGYSASFSVFGTFCMKKMVALRLLAMISNILFALYGFYGQLYPILLLHLALLPVNVFRFVQLRWAEPAGPVGCRAGSFSRNFSPTRIEPVRRYGCNEEGWRTSPSDAPRSSWRCTEDGRRSRTKRIDTTRS